MAMLGIDHQHGRQQSNEPGADTGVLGWQWRDAIYGAGASGGGWLGGTDAGAARVGQPEPARQGIGAPVRGADDGNEPGAGDAMDRQLRPDGAGGGNEVRAEEVQRALHRVRCEPVGLRRPSARQFERTGDPADPRARARRIGSKRLRTGGPNFGGCKKDCVNVVLEENEGERNDN